MESAKRYKAGDKVVLKSFENKVGEVVASFLEGHRDDRRRVYQVMCPNDTCCYNCIAAELEPAPESV